MREYMKQLLAQIEDAEAMHGPPYDAAINRLSGGKLEAGNRCSWCYADDLEFWGNPIPHPNDWFYHGLIMPLPDHDGRGVLEPDNCIVCVLDYPIEKENPEVDWTALLSVLTSPGLHRFHVMETIRMMGRKPATTRISDPMAAARPAHNNQPRNKMQTTDQTETRESGSAAFGLLGGKRETPFLLPNDTKIRFCNALDALRGHAAEGTSGECAACSIYLRHGDGDLCEQGKALIAKELCFADTSLELPPSD